MFKKRERRNKKAKQLIVSIHSESQLDDISLAATLRLETPKLLTWQVSTSLAKAIETAEKNAIQLIDDLDSVLLHYSDYGSDFMKQAKISPDAWLQMAYQLAYYRYYGKPCPTYESASTRKFIAGRTETVRSCSVESVQFTQAWEDKNVKVTFILELLLKNAIVMKRRV